MKAFTAIAIKDRKVWFRSGETITPPFASRSNERAIINFLANAGIQRWVISWNEMISFESDSDALICYLAFR